jgi:hypothetical protein
LIDSLTARHKEFGLVDLGDFTNSEATVGEMKTRFIWKTMEQLGYDASTPGVRELTNWTLYRELVAASPIKSVATNLVVVENGKESPAGLPTFVIEIGGVRVGFFSLIGAAEVSSATPPAGIEFRPQDPLTVARATVPELRKEAEIVVLMSEMSPQETDELLKQVQGIDVALDGRQPAWIDRAQKSTNTIVQQTGLRGQFAGQLVLIVDPSGKITEWGSRNGPLDSVYPEKAEVTAQIKQIEDQAKEMLKIDQQKKASEIESKISSDKFLGSEKCQRCHEQQYAHWLTTPHATAFATLEKQQKQADAQCVGCHVTGSGQPGGYAADVKEPDLRNVGCESCHAIGTKHGRGDKAAPITEATCTACHTGEWGKAKGWDFAAYMAKVKH